MSILKGIGALFALVLCASFAIAFLPNVADLTAKARTDAATDTNLACTADGSGDCNITLTSEHMYADTSGMTVTVAIGTSPNADTNVTANTTVNSNRRVLTITSLTAGNGYSFDVDFMKIDAKAAEATGLADFLNLAPFIFVLMLLVVGVIAGGSTVARAFR